MPSPDGIILGFDPGGKGAFGWSVCLAQDGCLEKRLGACVADDALSARDAVKRFVEENPAAKGLHVLAAGVDAPMFWGEQGNRKVDEYLVCKLRDTGFNTLSIIKVNSLRGAALVQGVLLGKYLLEVWDGLPITESHPRVVLHLLNRSGKRDNIVRLTKCLHNYSEYGELCLCGCRGTPAPQERQTRESRKEEERKAHMRDATLAAISGWAAWKAHNGRTRALDGWENLRPLESDAVQPFNTPVAYWMPKPATI